MTETDKILRLKAFTDEDLKDELARRRVVERARRHVTSAEQALTKARDKYELYVRTLKQEDELARKAKRV